MIFDLPTIGAGLPCATIVETLGSVLKHPGATAVVHAPPGTGKTTLVPPTVANAIAASLSDTHAAPGSPQRVIVTAPRRVAVRAAARRLAHLAGVTLGEEVGYTVRGDHRCSPRTIVEFCTPGVLLRRLLSDMELPGVAAIVLDEVHERHLDTDLALAFVRDLMDLREDLRLVVMSATVDAERFAELIGQPHGTPGPAPIIHASATVHPLDLRYRPSPVAALGPRGVEPAFLDHVSDQVMDLLIDATPASSPSGDILVFLPGVREVDHVTATLRARCADLPSESVEVLPLHGQLSATDQDRVVTGRERHASRRVIVATAIAESSLTVPGVRAVVDSCLSRGPRFDRARGMSGLVTTQSSQSSATQRAGRAARLGPGIAVRCIAESHWPRLDRWPTPEILVADLTSAMLMAAAWGTPGASGLALLDPPPTAHVERAHAILSMLGLLSTLTTSTTTPSTPSLTLHDAGSVVARLPLSPRLGCAFLTAAAALGVDHAAPAAAHLADSPRGDLSRATPSQRAQSEARRLTRLWSGLSDAERSSCATSPTLRTIAAELPTCPDPPLALLAGLAWPDAIARARRNSDAAGEYLTVAGTAAVAPPELRSSPWIVATELSRVAGASGGRSGAVVRSGVALTEATATLLASAMATTHREVTLPAAQGAVLVRTIRRLGAIELGATPGSPTRADIDDAVIAFVRSSPSEVTWDDAAAGLRARLALLREVCGDPWPDVSDAGIAAQAELMCQGVGEEVLSGRRGATRAAVMTTAQLERLLPWPEAARLEELVPTHLTVPSGSRVPITYTVGEAPRLEVKLQECFGLEDSPAVVEGRVPVVVHLLSPARRPVAVTSDLRSFWNGAYAQVRAELRGRYPKHPWPEDPWSAPATAATTRALRAQRKG